MKDKDKDNRKIIDFEKYLKAFEKKPEYIKIQTLFSKHIHYHRSPAQNRLETALFTKQRYFKRLKLNIQLFYLESFRAEGGLFYVYIFAYIALPTCVILEFMGTHYYFLKIYVTDYSKLFYLKINVHKWLPVRPYFFRQRIQDLIDYPINLNFLEKFLESWDLLAIITGSTIINTILLGLLAKGSPLHFDMNQDSETEKDVSEHDGDHLSSQLAYRRLGDVAYVKEFFKIRDFLIKEIYPYLLRVDVMLQLGYATKEDCEKQAKIIWKNLDDCLDQVAILLLQVREHDALLLKNPSFATSKTFFDLKQLHRLIYNPATCTQISKVYMSFEGCYKLYGEVGLIYYIDFDLFLEKDLTPTVKKIKAKLKNSIFEQTKQRSKQNNLVDIHIIPTIKPNVWISEETKFKSNDQVLITYLIESNMDIFLKEDAESLRLERLKKDTTIVDIFLAKLSKFLVYLGLGPLPLEDKSKNSYEHEDEDDDLRHWFLSSAYKNAPKEIKKLIDDLLSIKRLDLNQRGSLVVELENTEFPLEDDLEDEEKEDTRSRLKATFGVIDNIVFYTFRGFFFLKRVIKRLVILLSFSKIKLQEDVSRKEARRLEVKKLIEKLRKLKKK